MKLPLISSTLLVVSTLAAPALTIGNGRFPPGAPVMPSPSTRKEIKYFQEPGTSVVMGHYDARFYKEIQEYDDRRETLHHLIRSYLTFFQDNDIETWIAHGTLLGWWWNGKIMPWDGDLDVQVNEKTLFWLGENLNMTYHNYTSIASNGVELHREYLLDVNPNMYQRLRGSALNVIDARWIDTESGAFIDITGLSEVSPSTHPGIWQCKNYHRYKTRDLYPLRESIFEGVPTLIPYSFDRILTDEYTYRALTRTSFEGHTWNPERKEWEKVASDLFIGHGASSRPHIPRSLQHENEPAPGLANLLRLT